MNKNLSELKELHGVPETMLQTLYARAKETEKPGGKVKDYKAVEIVRQLEYDFTSAAGDAAMSNGVIARTILLDRMVSDYLQSHVDAAVINIACGMDTRFYRVDTGLIEWYDIDLPETMAVRQRFIPAEDRVHQIACSAMDETWADAAQIRREDTLVIVEGLSMYLQEGDIRKILDIIHRHFRRATVFLEVLNPRFVGKNIEKSIQGKSNAGFTWGIKSGSELTAIAPGFTWKGDRSLAETMPEIKPIYKLLGRIPAIRGLSNKICVLYGE